MVLTRGREGVNSPTKLADVLYVRPLAEVGGLVGVRRAQLRHQDPEDVHEEARVRKDAQQTCKCSRWIVFYRVTQKVLDLGWVDF